MAGVALVWPWAIRPASTSAAPSVAIVLSPGSTQGATQARSTGSLWLGRVSAGDVLADVGRLLAGKLRAHGIVVDLQEAAGTGKTDIQVQLGVGWDADPHHGGCQASAAAPASASLQLASWVQWALAQNGLPTASGDSAATRTEEASGREEAQIFLRIRNGWQSMQKVFQGRAAAQTAAVRVDVGFASNHRDRALWRWQPVRESLAQAISTGILAYLLHGRHAGPTPLRNLLTPGFLAAGGPPSGPSESGPAASGAPLPGASPTTRSETSSGPRVALVIDDFGYENPGAEGIWHLPVKRLTCAVLPNHPGSARDARRAWEKGWEVLVHLPMAARMAAAGGRAAESQQVMAGEGSRQIVDFVQNAAASVPFAVGLNNHMGSLATEDERVVRAVAAAAKSLDFFVLDSRTSYRSRLFAACRGSGVPAVANEMFIDDRASVPYIRQELRRLEAWARSRGVAVGIGHYRPATAAALALELPEMQRRGVRFVYVSDLTR